MPWRRRARCSGNDQVVRPPTISMWRTFDVEKYQTRFHQTGGAGDRCVDGLSPGSGIGRQRAHPFGMIGFGLRGQELLKHTLTLPNAQVVAVADVYTRRFDEARKISPALQTVGDYR